MATTLRIQTLVMYADIHGFTVLSKDSDFKNAHFINGTPKRLLKINLGNISTSRLIQLLDANLDLLVKEFQAEKCYIEIDNGVMNIIK